MMRIFWVVAGLCVACGRGAVGVQVSLDSGRQDVVADDCEASEDTAVTACTVNPQWARISIVSAGEGVGAYSSAALGSDGNPCVAYATGPKDAPEVGLQIACLGLQGWSARDLPESARVNPAWFGRSVALLFLANGRPLILFHDAKSGGLHGIHETEQGWALTTVDSKVSVGLDVSAAVGADGAVHVAYLDFADGDLRYARGTSGSWEVEVVDSEGFTGNDPSLALDGQGRVHITYFGCGNLTPSGCTGELRYAVQKSTGFTLEVVETGSDTGWYSALVLDKQDVPHVAWHVHALGQLRYAAQVDGMWRIEEVDSGPGAGAFASLALVDGNPVIAYQRAGTDGLVVAVRSSSGAWTRTTLSGKEPGSFASLIKISDCNLFCAWRDLEGLLAAFF